MSAQTPAEGLMMMAELMMTIAETVKGYRVQLEGMGFSPLGAEQMAIQFHQHILTTVSQAAST